MATAWSTRCLGILLVLAVAAPSAAVGSPPVVTGRLVDLDGQGISGARIALHPEKSLYEEMLAWNDVIHATAKIPTGQSEAPETGRQIFDAPQLSPMLAASRSDGDGWFEIQAPEAGLFSLVIDAPGLTPSQVPLHPLLEDRSVGNLTIEPTRTLALEVVDSDGAPIHGAWVEVSWYRPRSESPVRGEGWTEVVPRVQRVRTDGDGNALARVPQTGQTFLRLWAPGLVGRRTKDRVYAHRFRVPLMPGRTAEARIVDARGVGVADVLVVGAADIPIGRTDREGVVRFVRPSGEASRLRLLGADGQAVRVDLPAPEPDSASDRFTWRWPTVQTWSGRVVDARTQSGLSDALVWYGDDPGWQILTGRDGRYELPILREAEPYHFLVAARSGSFSDEVVGRSEHAENGVLPTIALEPAAAVFGKVLDSDGRPVAGASVRPQVSVESIVAAMLTPAAGQETPAVSDHTGRFRLSRVAPGVAYDLVIVKQGFAVGVEAVPPLEPRADHGELRIVLSEGGRAFGRVVGSTDEPVSGAEVRLEPRNPSKAELAQWLTRGGKPGITVLTDESGRFDFAGLTPGQFTLSVEAPAFAPTELADVVVSEEAGLTDLGTVHLDPGAWLEGMVVDDDGALIEGARLWIATDDLSSRLAALAGGDDRPEPDGTTDEFGFFSLDGLAPETVLDLRIESEGFAPKKVERVQVGGTEPLRIVLQRTARISGRVVDSEGRPVRSALVDWRQGGTWDLASLLGGGSSERRTITSDDGSFELENVVPGRVTVVAATARHRDHPGVTVNMPPGGEVRGLELVLETGAEIQGRVTTESGLPIPGAVVRVESEITGPRSPLGAAMTETDADGNYRLLGIGLGESTLTASGKRYLRTSRDLDVSEGLNRLNFVLDEGATISGRVVGPTGALVARAMVTISSELDPSLLARRFAPSFETTGEGGSFEFAGLRPGRYNLVATKEGYAAGDLGGEVEVGLDGVSGVELRLTTGVTVTVRIHGLESEELANLWANGIDRQPMLIFGKVELDGSYRLENVGVGDWNIKAMTEDGRSASEGVTIDATSGDQVIDLEFRGDLSLSGVVRVAGEPLVSSIVLLRSGNKMVRTSDTDRQGRFSMAKLEADRYELTVSDIESGLSHSQTVELAGDRDLVIDLQVGTMVGRVVDAGEGRPIAGAIITLERIEETFDAGESLGGRISLTDSGGQFALDQLPIGSYRLLVDREGYVREERLVEILSAAERRADFTLRPADALVLELRNTTGGPASDVLVAAFDAEGRNVLSSRYRAGEGGRLRIERLPPGTFDLVVIADGGGALRRSVTVPGPSMSLVAPLGGSIEVSAPALSDRGLTGRVKLFDPAGVIFRNIDGFGRIHDAWSVRGGEAADRVRIDHLPPGHWTVVLTTSDGTSWERQVVTQPGVTESVVFD